MPKCTGKRCICSWHWLAANGTGNFCRFTASRGVRRKFHADFRRLPATLAPLLDQTGFNCMVTGSPADATPVQLPLKDPVYCPDKFSDCTKGAKRPLYVYNSNQNVDWVDNYHRPGYHYSWGWKQGAQDDIFEPKKAVTTTKKSELGCFAPTGGADADTMFFSVATTFKKPTSTTKKPATTTKKSEQPLAPPSMLRTLTSFALTHSYDDEETHHNVETYFNYQEALHHKKE